MKNHVPKVTAKRRTSQYVVVRGKVVNTLPYPDGHFPFLIEHHISGLREDAFYRCFCQKTVGFASYPHAQKEHTASTPEAGYLAGCSAFPLVSLLIIRKGVGRQGESGAHVAAGSAPASPRLWLSAPYDCQHSRRYGIAPF